MNLGYVGVDDGGGAAVERDGAAQSSVGTSVRVDAVKNQIMRNLAERILRVVAKLYERVAESDGTSQAELDCCESEVMSSCIGQHSGTVIRRDDLRQLRRISRRDALARRREIAVGSGTADDNPSRAALDRKRKRSDVRRAGRQEDRVTGQSRIDRVLQVATRRN